MQNKTNKSLILAYEKVLMGKAKHIDNTFFSGSPEKIIVLLVRSSDTQLEHI